MTTGKQTNDEELSFSANAGLRIEWKHKCDFNGQEVFYHLCDGIAAADASSWRDILDGREPNAYNSSRLQFRREGEELILEFKTALLPPRRAVLSAESRRQLQRALDSILNSLR